MTIGDILVNTNRANLDNLLPLTEVKTKKDFAKFKKKGYTVGMTAWEFQEKYPLLPVEYIYASYNIQACSNAAASPLARSKRRKSAKSLAIG